MLIFAGSAALAGERYPEAVREALKKDPRYREEQVDKVIARRPAPTTSGFMFEVVIRADGGEQLVYVDPDQSTIIFETAPSGD